MVNLTKMKAFQSQLVADSNKPAQARMQEHTTAPLDTHLSHTCIQAIASSYQPQTPELDRKFLEREAAQGLPVKVRSCCWECLKDKALRVSKIDKMWRYVKMQLKLSKQGN